MGAGLLGPLIDRALAQYSMQGLNRTAAYSHAALSGVYGMLSIGLMVYYLSGLIDRARWTSAC